MSRQGRSVGWGDRESDDILVIDKGRYRAWVTIWDVSNRFLGSCTFNSQIHITYLEATEFYRKLTGLKPNICIQVLAHHLLYIFLGLFIL